MIILSMDERKGILELKVETEEDLWLLDLMISENDVVYAQTTREVKAKTGGKSRRLPMFLGIKVKKTEYHPFTNRLRITGIIIHGPEEFGLHGHYHTLSISIGHIITIVKEKGIRKSMLKKIKLSERIKQKIAVVAIDYEDFCLALAYSHGVKVLFTESLNIPGKASALREKVLEEKIAELVKKTIQAILAENVSNLVISGPGFLKEKFAKMLRENLNITGIGVNIIVEHSSTGGVRGAHEVIKSSVLRKFIKHFELTEKEKLFEEVMRRLSLEPEKIAIGLNEVARASELGAVEYLLILDRTLKDLACKESKTLEKILSNIEEYSGKVKIYTTHHDAGVQLKALGGIVALLRYPIRRDKA